MPNCRVLHMYIHHTHVTDPRGEEKEATKFLKQLCIRCGYLRATQQIEIFCERLVAYGALH